jgi:hypothetical protein
MVSGIPLGMAVRSRLEIISRLSYTLRGLLKKVLRRKPRRLEEMRRLREPRSCRLRARCNCMRLLVTGMDCSQFMYLS